jgi:hypothetical protein
MTPIQNFIKICVSFSQQHLNFAGCLNPSRFLTEKFYSFPSHCVTRVLLLHFALTQVKIGKANVVAIAAAN